MKILKKYDYIWKFILFILIFTFVLTIVNLIFPLKNSINSLVSLIAVLIYSLFVGFKKGMKVEEKAYKAGLILGFTNVVILYFMGFLALNFGMTIKKLLYFVIIIITTILGSIIGINKKNSR